MVYELKLSDDKTVRWEGNTGEAAANRYVDAHRDAVVIAWREPRVQLRVGYGAINE